MKPIKIVISCEHAVNMVPPDYLYLFSQHKSVLQSHRGIDWGALEIAIHLSQTINCDLETATVTRLLIDCNRSLTQHTCFSEFTRSLPVLKKQQLVDRYYLPFRERTENLIKSYIDKGNQVLHLSIHTFTPVLKGITRNVGIGLLYDPARHGEKEVARVWHGLILQEIPIYRMRKNYPYIGNKGGFTSVFRKKYPETEYLGIEVESNQALVTNKESLNELCHVLSNSLMELLQLL